jgi:hypothetical protein
MKLKEEFADLFDIHAAVLVRMDRAEAFFRRLRLSSHRFRAVFGNEAAQPFVILLDFENTIRGACQTAFGQLPEAAERLTISTTSSSTTASMASTTQLATATRPPSRAWRRSAGGRSTVRRIRRLAGSNDAGRRRRSGGRRCALA